MLRKAHQRGESALHAVGQGLVLTLRNEFTIIMTSISDWIAMQPRDTMHSPQLSACLSLTGLTLVQPASPASHKRNCNDALNLNCIDRVVAMWKSCGGELASDESFRCRCSV